MFIYYNIFTLTFHEVKVFTNFFKDIFPLILLKLLEIFKLRQQLFNIIGLSIGF